MAAEAKSNEATTRCSFLLLLCPGTGQSFGKGRKMAISTNNQKNVCKNDNVKIKNCVKLNGLDQDAATMTKYLKGFGDNNNMIAYKSIYSANDALLTSFSAKDRINRWYQEPNVKRFILYFSGHGSKTGICFNGDDILLYIELAQITLSNAIKGKATTIIIDACHSGAIKDVFVEIMSGEKMWFQLQANIVLLYASTKDQISADCGTSGGAFTRHYFEINARVNSMKSFIFYAANFKSKTWHHTYQDGSASDQQAGSYVVCNPLFDEHILEGFMPYAAESKIRQSIKLLNEYWCLLKESNVIIAQKKSEINRIIQGSQRWKKILTKRIAFEMGQGQAPTQQHIEYMISVQKAVCNYFSTKSDVEYKKWDKLYEQLSEQYVWWQCKYEWFKDYKRRQQEKRKEQAIWFNPIRWQNGDQQQSKTLMIEQRVKNVMNAFGTMKNDACIRDKLFSDFGMFFSFPKEIAKAIEDEVEEIGKGDDFNWFLMDDNVGEIINSLERLNKICVDLMEQSDKIQTNFYKEYKQRITVTI